jgi:mevalonate kinase
MNETFYSKVILFGEYSMIFDGTALMIPLRRYKAEWKMNPALDQPGEQASNRSIRNFRQYLANDVELSQLFDFQRFDADLDQGLFLDSDVPSGYGLGSSGTLTAAVYKRFAYTPIDDILELKRILGKMENCFHGSSSGIDPLQCYLNRPFKITSAGATMLPEDFMPADIHVFLADTGIKSNTKPLVQYFKGKREHPEYLNAFQLEYVPCVKACIEQLIEGQKEAFFASLRQLTDGQLRFLRPMITDNTIDLFLERPDFHIGFKISGSGGGGYVLGFTDDVDRAKCFMEGYQLIWV